MRVKRFNGVCAYLRRLKNQQWFVIWGLNGYDNRTQICKTQEKAWALAERAINKRVTQ